MDPFSAPSWGTAPNYQGELAANVAQTAPLAQNWNGAQTGVNIQQVFNKTPTPPPSSNISKFFHFIGGVGSEIGHIAGGATKWLGQQVGHMATAIPREAQGFSHAILDNIDINNNNARTQQNSDKLDSLHALYKSGRISTKDYQLGLKELIADNNSLTEQQLGLQNRIKADQSQAIQATVDTAAVLTTILTAGFGRAAATAVTSDGLVPVAEKGAADYLASTSAVPFLSNVEQGLNKLATDPALFAKLSPAAQKAFQTSVAEVVAGNAGTMTSGQIARASAANLALKYPIYYNMLSTQGQQIYQKLDNKQYGSAVQQLAFNAALILSGGVIGQALKFGKKVTSATQGAVFGRTAFLDELSKGIGDGNPAGLYNAINKIADPTLRGEVIRNLSAVEATNLEAVTGRDSVAAAWRVLNGMSSYEGVSMNQFTHEEALNNMVNFAKAQRLVDEVGKAKGLGPITVGRVDARVLNMISARLSPIGENILGKIDEHGQIYLKDLNDKETLLHEVSHNIYRTMPEQQQGALEYTLREFTDKNPGVFSTRFPGQPEENVAEAAAEFAQNRKDFGDRFLHELRAVSGGSQLEDFFNKVSAQATATPATDIKSFVDERLKVWEQLKAENPTQAWANNENFDRQIKALINKHDTPGALDESIRGIRASFQVEGFPVKEARELSQMGYLPIKPVKLEAPFQEGTGKLATAFTQGDEFFTKAVQPVPVLSSVGSLLTHMGLSPSASTSRVYELFNNNLAENLTQSDLIKSTFLKGENDAQSADNIIKRLSSYAHNPTRGVHINEKPLTPITDLRQLTTKDIMEALQATHSQATEVKNALMDAMLQVPLQVRD